MKIRNLLSFSLIFLADACVVVGSDTESATDGASTTSSGSNSAATTAADTVTSNATATASEAASDSTSSGSDSSADPTSTTDTTTAGSDSDTTTGVPEPLLESCKAACEVLFGCYPDEFDSLEVCVEMCVDDSADPDAACEAAYIDLNECLGAASCEDFEGDDFCIAEEEASADACPDTGCIIGISGDQEECNFTYECPGEFENEFRCTVDSCECFEDGMKTLECEPMINLCADVDMDALEDYAFECCGW